MLVISRCLNSAIRIGDNVKVKVLRLGQRRVTLGIDAPSEVQVRRDELTDESTNGCAKERESPELDLRVLVVEDTPVHALLIERVLTKRGVRNIVRTSSGEDAIRLLTLGREGRALKPDLVLLDLQLPGVSGFHVLEAIKSAGTLRSIPVVVLSVSDSDADVARCMEAGANAFVSKSESYDNLRQSIIRITDFWSQVRKVG
jgi:two-component system, chemotaxis family, response regulator Rcp1